MPTDFQTPMGREVRRIRTDACRLPEVTTRCEMPTPAIRAGGMGRLQGTTLGWPFGVTAAPYLCPLAHGGWLQAEHSLPPCFCAPPQSHGAAHTPRDSSWVWGEPQHPATAAPGAAPAAAHPCLSATRVSLEHWCFWQLPAAKERVQIHPTAQLVSSYLQVINKSFTVYCNHSAKTQTKSIAVTTSKAACSHGPGKQTFWVLPSEKGVYRTLGGPGSSSCDSCVQDKFCLLPKPLCRGTDSSKITPCRGSPEELVFSPGTFCQGCKEPSRAVGLSPTFPPLQRRTKPPSHPQHCR